MKHVFQISNAHPPLAKGHPHYKWRTQVRHSQRLSTRLNANSQSKRTSVYHKRVSTRNTPSAERKKKHSASPEFHPLTRTHRSTT
ncbi:hypothetical protein HanRHA438_Chr09g0402981 [Helianthus annuus]|nr:hypothetical protein HanRHA438_Chr09g0402981 [Helianthus annuus]